MSKFTEAVERELEGLYNVAPGVASACDECDPWGEAPIYADDPDAWDEWAELAREPSFSWTPCDSCGSSLGGNRHPAHAFDGEGRMHHLDVCDDCLIYHANGEEPNPIDGVEWPYK